MSEQRHHDEQKHHRNQDYNHIEILEIQMRVRRLEEEAVGRYISNPDNLQGIREAIKVAFRLLSVLPAERANCPYGWRHMSNCVCKIDPEYP